MAAFANPVESVAGRDYPRIRRGTLQILAEVFEDSGIFRRHRGKVVEGLINARRQTRRGHIMAEDAAIDNLAEERRARHQLTQQVLNVLLAVGREGFIIPGAATERDYDCFSDARRGRASRE